MSTKQTKLAPLIAIVGCDGSGKSTVSEQTLIFVRGYGPAASAHLGKQAGNMGRSLSNLPLVGKWIERLISRKTKTVSGSYDKNKTPEILPALVMYLFAIRRVRRFKRMLALREQGLIIVADRYPQLEYPRAYDGPALSVSAQGNFIIRWLARKEQKAFEWMTSYKPDLVIRLNVDIDTACERKPDHVREALLKKIEVTPLLTFNGANIVEVDTVQPLADVLTAVETAVSKTLTEHGFKKLNT